MRKQCRVIAVLELVLGILGSFLIAKSAGLNVFTGKRNWLISIIIFIIGIGFSYLFLIVMYSISEILRNQDQIIEFLEKKESFDTKPPAKTSNSNNSASLLGSSSKSGFSEEDGWICSKCGTWNPNSSSRCQCGKSKY